jgi:hypothetical protein
MTAATTGVTTAADANGMTAFDGAEAAEDSPASLTAVTVKV